MLGLAVGDALGWPMEDRGGRVGGTAKLRPAFEFIAWQRREGGSYAPNLESVRAGEYSDDTQLALAVARSRSVNDDWWSYLTQVELPLWTIYGRGGGGATKSAAQSWLHGRPPWAGKKPQDVKKYFAAGGNGAVMRCLPHCLAPSSRRPVELNRALDLDGATTHGHPRALVGSRLYGAAVSWALERDEPLSYGGLITRLLDTTPEWAEPLPMIALSEASAQDTDRWEAEWVRTVEEVTEMLRISLDGLAEGAVAVDRPVLNQLGAFGSFKGAGTITAVAAVFLASRYASQPQQGLLSAAFARGADTDTLACLTAGLLGALHGPDWLEPLGREVQDASYIVQAADAVLEETAAAHPTGPWGLQQRRGLYRWLENANLQDTASLSVFGEATVRNIQDHETKAMMFVRSWEMATELGQSLQIKRYERGKDNQPKWQSLTPPRPEQELSPKVRAGLVLEVTDLARARRFYEQVIGLEVLRATDEYITFGWLALEQADLDTQPGQLELKSPTQVPAQTIRVYVLEDSLERVRQQVEAIGLPISEGAPRFQGRAFRCMDPDGHTIEFVARNGRPPVI